MIISNPHFDAEDFTILQESALVPLLMGNDFANRKAKVRNVLSINSIGESARNPNLSTELQKKIF